jgi:large subunit ribosomal protein L24
VTRAAASLAINAGQARFRDIVVQTSGAKLDATANLDLTETSLDALLTLTGAPQSGGGLQPSVMVALKGALPRPRRSVDTSLLASWLALRAVEQQAKKLEDIERGQIETPPTPTAALRQVPLPPARMDNVPTASTPSAGASAAASAANASAAVAVEQAPPLPPPVTIPALPRPRPENLAAQPAARPSPPPRRVGAPLDLLRAQH